MLILKIIGFGLTVVALMVVVFSRRHAVSVLSLLALSLWNVPLYILGNSSSAGIFPVDILLAVVIVKYFFSSQGKILNGLLKDQVGKVFGMLLIYVVFQTLFLIIAVDYGSYSRFLIYGIFRWLTFLFLLIIFCRQINQSEILWVLKSLGLIFILYFTINVLHQLRVVDLSALSETGYAALYEKGSLDSLLNRVFLGGNSATTGFLTSVGVFLSPFLMHYSKWKLKAFLLFILSISALVGSFSRTDLIVLGGCLFFGMIFFSRSIYTNKFAQRLLPVSVLIFIVFGIWIMLSNRSWLDIDGIARVFSTDYSGEIKGSADGTLTYRIYHWKLALTYMLEDANRVIFGFGANGYRMLNFNGVGHMGFGHNVWMHHFVELGLVGLVLFCAWLMLVMRGLRRLGKISNFHNDLKVMVFLILMHRILAGATVDSFFAVDNMLTMNAYMLFFVGVSLNLKNVMQKSF